MNKNLFIASILAIPIFFGCKKNSTELKQPTSYKSVDFTKIDLGKAHNDAVKVVIFKQKNMPGGRLSNHPEEVKPGILNAAKNIPLDASPTDFATLGISQDDLYDWISYMSNELAFYEYDVNNYPINNADVLKYTNKIISGVNSANTLEDIDLAMDAVQRRANSELKEFNLDIVTGTIQIAKSSARLWAPTELGGENLMSQNGMNFKNMSGRWRAALIGDISGSAQYFMGLGAACALGWAPGANVVILGGWAISAGVSSAFGALGITCSVLPPKPKEIQPLPPTPPIESN